MQAMQVDEALEYADEWIKGVTVYEGAQGWRVACATLAAEVRRLRAMVGGAGDTSQKLIDRLEMLEVQAVREIAPGWIGIPAIEWDLIMGPNAKAVGLDAAGGQSHTSDGLGTAVPPEPTFGEGENSGT